MYLLFRISPSEGESVDSDPPSERGSPEDGTRPAGQATDPKQPRKAAVNGLNGTFVYTLTGNTIIYHTCIAVHFLIQIVIQL